MTLPPGAVYTADAADDWPGVVAPALDAVEHQRARAALPRWLHLQLEAGRRPRGAVLGFGRIVVL
jgi:hypothetical protein